MENIWTVNIMDTILSQLSRNSTTDFEQTCTMLEKYGEVYSQRVDSVYAEVMRISDELKESGVVESRNAADPSTLDVCEATKETVDL